MKTVSDDKLCNDFPAIEAMLSAGEVVGVTKRERVIARLTPEPVLEQDVRPPLPDFLARMKEIMGDKVLSVSGAEIISEGRDRF